MFRFSNTTSFFRFFALVVLLSVPLWMLGFTNSRFPGNLQINLPISAMMAACPFLAAIILHKGKKNGLLTNVFDFKKIKKPIWVFVIVLMFPAVMILAYITMRFRHIYIPDFIWNPGSVIVLIPLFLVGAILEESGWMGFAFDPLQEKTGALNAAFIMGFAWAAWHIIPLIQTHRGAEWICWQCISQVAIRIIIVWIYNNTGKSVAAAIIFHAMTNLGEFLFPDQGSHYNPFYTDIFLLAIVCLIIIFLKPENLTEGKRPKIRPVNKTVV